MEDNAPNKESKNFKKKISKIQLRKVETLTKIDFKEDDKSIPLDSNSIRGENLLVVNDEDERERIQKREKANRVKLKNQSPKRHHSNKEFLQAKAIKSKQKIRKMETKRNELEHLSPNDEVDDSPIHHGDSFQFDKVDEESSPEPLSAIKTPPEEIQPDFYGKPNKLIL